MIQVKGFAALDPTSPLEPYNFERRDLREHDVLVDILFSGVCHSDLHQVRDEWGGSIYPMVPGHEIVGKVIKVGSHVKKFKVGDHAGIGCLVDSCRECDNCKEGLEQYCSNGMVGTYGAMEKDGSGPTNGGYSKSILAHEDFILRISGKQPLEAIAPLLCAGITTYSPLRYWKVGKGTRVGVVGLGGLGHMAVKLAASMGAEVTMLSHSAWKKADAHRLGAHNFVLSTDEEQTKTLAGYFDFIIDTVSAAHDYNFFLAMLRTNGVMVCVGAPPAPAQIPAFNLIFGRKSFAGSLIGGIPETQEMLDYCAKHNIVSDIELIAMKDINGAYERMLKGDVKYRFVIDMGTL